MFDWLFEGHLSVYLLLLGGLVLLLWLWKHQDNRQLLLAAIIPALFMILYSILDWSVQTDREVIQTQVERLSSNTLRRDLNALLADISERFRIPGIESKQQLRDEAGRSMQFGVLRNLESLTVWNFVFESPPSREQGTGKVRFHFKMQGKELPPAATMAFQCEATFALEPPRAWRLTGFRVFDPGLGNEEIPVRLP